MPGEIGASGAHVEELAPSAASAARRAPAAPTNGPRFSATIRAMFGGFGAETDADRDELELVLARARG